MPERKLGAYRLVSQIAVGGMAEIYSAKTAGVGGFEKLVALKVIHPNYSEDPEFVQMLVDEAKLAVQLQHANIVQTFDLGFVENQYYIAMELIDGIDLYKLLRRSSEKDLDFPFEVAVFVAQEAAQGLDYAHRKRDERGRPLEIVHRDISPQNILVSFDGEVKIVDFGIAKAARRAKQTAAGVIKGKYYYMSPEQAWGDPIDARTDIFSTGILLYEMLVGQMLYLEEDMDVLLEKVRKAIIAKPSTKRKDVPLQLETIVMKALAKRPQDRYQTAGELATALGRFLRTRAPDFNRGKLAAWVQKVLGNEPTDRNQVRDPKISTAVRRAEIERDEHSLLFKLEDLKKQQRKADPVASKAPNAPAPRRGDQATSPVRMPELAQSLRGDFEENDATIVDGTGETLMATPLRDDEEEDDATEDADESTRPMGNARQLREVVTGQTRLDDDPSEDTAFEDEEVLDSSDQIVDDRLSSLGDEGDTNADRTSLERLQKRAAKTAPKPAAAQPAAARPSPLGKPSLPKLPGRPAAKPAPLRPLEPRLPGVRSPGPPADSAPQALYEDSGPLTDEDSENTSERLKPTQTLRPEPPLRSAFDDAADDEETAVSGGRVLQPGRPLAISVSAPTQAAPLPDAPPSTSAAPNATLAMGPTQPLPPGSLPSNPPPPSAASPVLPWGNPPPPSGNASAFPSPGAPTALPLPPGLPVLPTTPSAQFPLVPSGPGASGRFSTDAVVASLQPRRSRLALVLIGSAMLAAAIVAVLTAGPSPPVRGTIEVVSSPAGAEVRIDGTAVNQPTPLVITDVDPGRSHHVVVGKHSYDSWESEVKFEGDTRQVRLQAILVPQVVSLAISSTPPGAEAVVNGQIAGTTPTTVGDLSPEQEVTVELRLRGYRVAHRSFSLANGKRKLEVSIPLEKAR